MGKELKNESSTVKQTDSTHKLQNLSGIKLVEFGESTGFTCDVETGICGPIDQKEEDKK